MATESLRETVKDAIKKSKSWRRQKNYPLALTHIREALKLCGEGDDTKNGRYDLLHHEARIHLELRCPEAARATVAAMKALNPNHYLPYLLMGAVCALLKEDGPAIACYNNAIARIKSRRNSPTDRRKIRALKFAIHRLERRLTGRNGFDRDGFSDELFLLIFELLDFPQVVRCMRVCKRWQQLLSSPQLRSRIEIIRPCDVLARPLPRSIVPQITAHATRIKSLVWRSAYPGVEMPFVHDVLTSAKCKDLEDLTIDFKMPGLPSDIAARSNSVVTNFYLHLSRLGENLMSMHSLRSIELFGGVKFDLTSLEALLKNCRNLQHVRGPIVDIRTKLASTDPWPQLPHLQHLALSHEPPRARPALNIKNLPLALLANAACNLKVLELQCFYIDIPTINKDNPLFGNPPNLDTFSKLERLCLTSSCVKSIGRLPETLESVAFDDVQWIAGRGLWTVSTLPNLKDVSVSRLDPSRAECARIGAWPPDLLRFLTRPGNAHATQVETLIVPLPALSLTALRVLITSEPQKDREEATQSLIKIIQLSGFYLQHVTLLDRIQCVDDRVAQAIASAGGKLKTLELEEATVTGAGVGAIIRSHAKSLQSVQLSYCPNISEPDELVRWASTLGVTVKVKKTLMSVWKGKKIRYDD